MARAYPFISFDVSCSVFSRTLPYGVIFAAVATMKTTALWLLRLKIWKRSFALQRSYVKRPLPAFICPMSMAVGANGMTVPAMR